MFKGSYYKWKPNHAAAKYHAKDVLVYTTLRQSVVAVELWTLLDFIKAGPAVILLNMEQRAINQHRPVRSPGGGGTAIGVACRHRDLQNFLRS